MRRTKIDGEGVAQGEEAQAEIVEMENIRVLASYKEIEDIYSYGLLGLAQLLVFFPPVQLCTESNHIFDGT